ncbi:MAG TPA: aminoacyl-tRNA hydrolase [Chloroflexota bacterium]|nr:aminoacyl-tRNA hydrolase [Chloroflexota bacterium]
MLIVGLGNPGPQYERTRHNVGFMTANVLARRYHLNFRSSKQRADVARGAIGGRSVILAQPMTYMNESGNAVSRLLQYYKIPATDLLVIADDLNLPFGTLRIRPSGSSGGQKGVQSVIDTIGTDEFARLRLGIGRPRGETIDYVLNRFPPAEEALLPKLLDVAADAVEAVLTRGVKDAMNSYNRDWLPDLDKSILAKDLQT